MFIAVTLDIHTKI